MSCVNINAYFLEEVITLIIVITVPLKGLEQKLKTKSEADRKRGVKGRSWDE